MSNHIFFQAITARHMLLCIGSILKSYFWNNYALCAIPNIIRACNVPFWSINLFNSISFNIFHLSFRIIIDCYYIATDTDPFTYNLIG